MAGRIPQEFIDQLLDRTDIYELINSRVTLKRAGRDYQARCPFHDEKSPSFTVSPVKNFYHCFGCGAHGNAIGFLMEYDRLEFLDAVEELAKAAGMTVPREASERQDGLGLVYDVLKRVQKLYQRQLKDSPEAVAYLKQRGISGDVAKTYALGFAPDAWDTLAASIGGDRAGMEALDKAGLVTERQSGGYYDKFRNRIMFPIHDGRGRPVAFGGRVFRGDDGPKYMNSPETVLFHKGRQLYGLYQARQANSHLERLIVVEGYMDVIALAQAGITETVATLGTATTTEHAEILFRSAPEVVFCFDGDRAGRKAALRAMESVMPRLRDGRQVRFQFLPEGEDPDSLVRSQGAEEFINQLERATPLSEFFFAHYQAQVDMQSLDGRARLVEMCRPKLSQVPDGAFRDMMFEELSHRAQSQAVLGPHGAVSVPMPRAAGQRSQPSLVRRAVTILLHYPRLAMDLGDVSPLLALERRGVPLLVELVQWCQLNPGASFARLLEHWRDRPEQVYLEKLAAPGLLGDRDPRDDLEPGEENTPSDEVHDEFIDAISRLRRQADRQRMAELESRVAQVGMTGLSEDEKSEWRALQSRRQ